MIIPFLTSSPAAENQQFTDEMYQLAEWLVVEMRGISRTADEHETYGWVVQSLHENLLMHDSPTREGDASQVSIETYNATIV